MVQISDWAGLWDRGPNLIKYHEAGLNLHERLYRFLIEFAKLQKESFSLQKKLCERYYVDAKKVFGVSNSYAVVFNEVIRIVQHIVDAESLISSSFELHANNEGKCAIEDEKKQFKVWKNERTKLNSALKSQVRIIDEEIKRYRDKYKEMIKAKEDYERIRLDQTHSHLDVRKALCNARSKISEFERARRDYGAALNQFNLYRRDHFFRYLPLWAQSGHELKLEQYNRTQKLVENLHERLRVATDRLYSVSSEFQKACSILNSDQDSSKLINHLVSGYSPPTDIAVVDLDPNPTPLSPINNTDFEPSDMKCDPKYEAIKPNNNNNDSEKINCNYSEPVYSSGNSIILPPEFFLSVSAADRAAFSRRSDFTLESIYMEPNSVMFSQPDENYVKPTTHCRREKNFGVGSGYGVDDGVTLGNYPNAGCTDHSPTGIFRKFFSRRSRPNITNISEVADLISGWSHPLFEPIVPWRRSSRYHNSKRNLSSFRKKLSAQYYCTAVDENDSSALRITQSTGDLSVANLKVMEDNANGNRSNRQLISQQSADHYGIRTKSIMRLSSLKPKQLPNDYTTTEQINKNNDSDFSDSSLDESGCRVISIKSTDNNNNNNDNIAYATTSVLTGLDKNKLNRINDLSSLKSNTNIFITSVTTNTTNTTTTTTPTNTINSNNKFSHAPLAKPELEIINSSYSTSNNQTNVLIVEQDSKSNLSSVTFKNGHESIKSSNGKYNNNNNNQQSNNYVIASSNNSQSKPNNSNTKLNHVKTNISDESINSKTKSSIQITNSHVINHNNNNNVTIYNDSSKKDVKQSNESVVIVGGCTALYSFTAEGFGPEYLPFDTGEQFYILASSPSENTNDWLHVLRLTSNEKGYVPTAYMEQSHYAQPFNCLDRENPTELIYSKPDNVSIIQSSSSLKTNSNRPAVRNYRGNKPPTSTNSPYKRLTGVTRDTDL